MNRPLAHLLIVAAGALFAANAHASAYAIDSAASQLNFVSIKNNAVAETHRFGSVSGGVADDGAAEVLIALATVDTGIEIRDSRMRELLFDVPNHPLARLNAQVPAEVLQTVASGAAASLELPAKLELFGTTQDITLPLLATPSEGGDLLVTTRAPVVVQAEDFGLGKGVTQLREIAGLNAIATAVPVTFVLRLVPVNAEE